MISKIDICLIILILILIFLYFYKKDNKEHFLWTPNYVDINYQPAFSQYMYFDGYMIPVR